MNQQINDELARLKQIIKDYKWPFLRELVVFVRPGTPMADDFYMLRKHRLIESTGDAPGSGKVGFGYRLTTTGRNAFEGQTIVSAELVKMYQKNIEDLERQITGVVEALDEIIPGLDADVLDTRGAAAGLRRLKSTLKTSGGTEREHDPR